MKRFGILILAATLGAGFSNSVPIQAAEVKQTSIKIPTNLALGGKATASGEYAPHQGKEKAFDQDIHSKWLTFNSPAWLQYEFPAAKVITSYSITSAEDEPYRDPKSWVLKGSNDGTNWTQLDVQQNQSFASRHQTKTYSFSNKTAYKFVKFDNFHNQYGSGMLQISEIKLFDGSSKKWSTTKPEVAASGEKKPNQTKENLVDGTSVTKWFTKDNTAWLTFNFGKPVTIDGYSLTAADDRPERDPKSWVLQGSNDNKNWTSIDKKSNEMFTVRHQRKYYLLDKNTTAYQYYRLSNMKNHSGNSMQLGEVEFSRTDDVGHAINPKIEVQILDAKGKGKIFRKALPNAEKEILAVARKVHEMLYKSPADAPADVKKILVTIVDSPDGVAWASGDATLKTIGFSVQYLQNFVESPAKSLRDEIIGILYHEIGHCYQYSHFDVEGIADSLRFKAGYHDRYGVRKGGSWEKHGTANFYRWIDDTKKRGFIRELNATQVPYNIGGENEKRLWKERQIKLITGTDVQTLWSQYQATLPN